MIKGVLLDVSGVLQAGNDALPGAIDSVQAFRDASLPIRLLSNTSRKTCDTLLQELNTIGFTLRPGELLTAPRAAKSLLDRNKLKPFLLVHPDLEPEFEGNTGEDAVLVADAGDAFTPTRMQMAFRLLMDGKPLFATGVNRYFRDGDRLALDAGPYVKALEFAANVTATVTGKPSASFFEAAADDIGIAPENLIMIGDDAENDVLGARKAGLQALLVRTGKFTEGDEIIAGSEFTVADIGAATRRILEQVEVQSSPG